MLFAYAFSFISNLQSKKENYSKWKFLYSANEFNQQQKKKKDDNFLWIVNYIFGIIWISLQMHFPNNYKHIIFDGVAHRYRL
jgi:hypothetical protein